MCDLSRTRHSLLSDILSCDKPFQNNRFSRCMYLDAYLCDRYIYIWPGIQLSLLTLGLRWFKINDNCTENILKQWIVWIMILTTNIYNNLVISDNCSPLFHTFSWIMYSFAVFLLQFLALKIVICVVFSHKK